MLRYAKRLLSGDERQACLGCHRRFDQSGLVFINHCHHSDKSNNYNHRTCSGFRLLCSSCHLKIGTRTYYEDKLLERARDNPEQYPWEDAMIGMKKYLVRMEKLVARGIDPTDWNAVEINW